MGALERVNPSKTARTLFLVNGGIWLLIGGVTQMRMTASSLWLDLLAHLPSPANSI